jgi:hypothetical protein
MNWRRGLFRLWVIGTMLFVMALAMVGYNDIKKVIAYSDIKKEFDAAVKAEVDAAARKPGAGQPISGDWAMPTPTDARLVTDPKVLARLNGAVDPDEVWANAEYLAGIAAGVPLAVLALGASLVWAFSGFSAKRP